MTRSVHLPLTTLRDLPPAFSVEERPNGAVHIQGPLDNLRALREHFWESNRIDLRLIESATIDGIPQEGYPRIEIHPSVIQR